MMSSAAIALLLLIEHDIAAAHIMLRNLHLSIALGKAPISEKSLLSIFPSMFVLSSWLDKIALEWIAPFWSKRIVPLLLELEEIGIVMNDSTFVTKNSVNVKDATWKRNAIVKDEFAISDSVIFRMKRCVHACATMV